MKKPPNVPQEVWDETSRPVTLIGGPKDGERVVLHLGAEGHHVPTLGGVHTYWLDPEGEIMTYDQFVGYD